MMQNYEMDILINYFIALSGCICVMSVSTLLNRVVIFKEVLAYIGHYSLFFYPITNYIPMFIGRITNDSMMVNLAGCALGFITAYICSIVSIGITIKRRKTIEIKKYENSIFYQYPFPLSGHVF